MVPATDVVAVEAGEPGPLTPLGRVVGAGRGAAVAAVRRWNRLEIDTTGVHVDRPSLFVANHGFGGVFDLNVAATLAALDRLRLERPVTVLAHQLAWTVGLGPLLESIGVRKASWDNAGAALDAGDHVLVFPGGDIDSSKPFRDRHRVDFDGRSGFARLALGRGVPAVPVVTAGAGASLLVLDRGRWLARLLHTNDLARLKSMPISLSVPWGLSPGLVGLLPYLPLPVKLRTVVLPPMTAAAGEDAERYADRIVETMQAALTRLARRR